MANDLDPDQVEVEDVYIHQCDLCKHTWLSKKELPKACPRCKRYDWNGKGGLNERQD